MKNLLSYGLAGTAFAVVMAFGAPAMADPTPAPSPAASSAASSQLVGQASEYNLVNGSDNEAAVEQNAFQFAIGNIGANVASGTANQQANALYIDNGKSSFQLTGGVVSLPFGDGTVTLYEGQGTLQSSYGNADFAYSYNSGSSDDQSAYIQDNAFGNAKGNIGVNVAAGNLNEQANTTVILNQDQLAATNTGAAQLSECNGFSSSNNEGEIEDQAFENAFGNVGANVAAGEGNQQSNQLIINNNNGSTP